ncbi:MAG: LCP family protein [Lachnobacterium sp.]|nr:LCP family protein [Lachnobacterium sp.]
MIQALISIVSVGIVVWFNLLPLKYLVLIGLILIWLLTLVYYFFYSGVRKKKGKKLTAQKKKRKLYIKRSIGGVISAITMALCIVASSMVWQAGNALANIADNVVVTDTVSVYALADNPAESVADIKDGVFAITQNYDYEHTKTTLDKIRENLGQDVHTQNYDTVFDMVDALYAGNVDAMILNVAYVDVIRDQKGYEDFSDRTKTLYDHEVKTSVVQENTQDTRDITKDPFIIYISGSDTRNLNLATSRSDVNILAVVNPASKQVLLLNTPRDYYVETTVSGGMRDKLTHCGIYGIDCSMGTLTNLYEENVDYYVQINFNGFETLIDAIGGITVEAEKSFRTSEGGYYISQGTNQLSGAVALSYVRERKSFADGDNARGRHQMQAIEAIIKKVSSGTTVLNNYSAILSSMEGMFATNMSSSEISALVRMQLTDMASWNVKSFAVTGTGSSQKTYSMPTKRSYVMIPDESQIDYARKLVDKVVDGGILSDNDLIMP